MVLSCFPGHPGEELHPQLSEARLADGTFHSRELGGRAHRQEDDAAGRGDLGRDPASWAGPMTISSTTHFKTAIFSFMFICVFYKKLYIIFKVLSWMKTEHKETELAESHVETWLRWNKSQWFYFQLVFQMTHFNLDFFMYKYRVLNHNSWFNV